MTITGHLPRRSVAEPSALTQGVRGGLSVVLAYVPFGTALGAALAHTGVSALTAWSSSPLLFGGAAQLVAVQLLAAGAPAGVVVAAAMVVNARLLLYSASLAPHARGWPRRWRWLGAYLLVDPVYALAVGRFSRSDDDGDPARRLRFYLGAGATMWVGWLAITGLGVLVGGLLPAALPLQLAAPLTFLVLLLPMLTGRAAAAAAVVGGLVALAASGLPLGLGLLCGAAAGVGAGVLAGGRDA
ncbi:AzlC family ABC transporter permease [Actinomycetospora sp. TBRC 11914]|uniref:AzlC family ABC transporter permease n=1 Tax=Actinomycetospora sp. TBRC 11914 TaxID=2729387 RepID=UPI00145F0FB1|nr:AzlC family ABC transporter permease [Actinomycetospora sp. TBRC 11914]NMO88950.1 branched-chain amino acid ABC transporter permease [Actinomycetospora sp. TBRC 11914]